MNENAQLYDLKGNRLYLTPQEVDQFLEAVKNAPSEPNIARNTGDTMLKTVHSFLSEVETINTGVQQ